MGAVATVAPSEDVRSLFTTDGRGVGGSARIAAPIPHTAAADNQAPADVTAVGSTASTMRNPTASTAPDGGWRCRSLETAAIVMKAAARVAGAGHPSRNT